WNLADFESQHYHLKVYGPNGFFREYSGNKENSFLKVECAYQLDRSKKPTGHIELKISNLHPSQKTVLKVTDNTYGAAVQTITLEKTPAGAKSKKSIVLNLAKSFNWYDFTVAIEGAENAFSRFAGHVETGAASQSDPYMGQMLS
ncbi:MAG TPA: phospholipase domain-containing protein, partial [Dyadobacter sp.]|nr:phospholipase domain-containing protein [Dyadobacter sp.]